MRNRISHLRATGIWSWACPMQHLRHSKPPPAMRRRRRPLLSLFPSPVRPIALSGLRSATAEVAFAASDAVAETERPRRYSILRKPPDDCERDRRGHATYRATGRRPQCLMLSSRNESPTGKPRLPLRSASSSRRQVSPGAPGIGSSTTRGHWPVVVIGPGQDALTSQARTPPADCGATTLDK